MSHNYPATTSSVLAAQQKDTRSYTFTLTLSDISFRPRYFVYLALAIILPIVAFIKLCSSPLRIKGVRTEMDDSLEEERPIAENNMVKEEEKPSREEQEQQGPRTESAVSSCACSIHNCMCGIPMVCRELNPGDILLHIPSPGTSAKGPIRAREPRWSMYRQAALDREVAQILEERAYDTIAAGSMTLIEMYMREEDAEHGTGVSWPDEEMDWFAGLEEEESESEVARRVENDFIRFGE